MILSGIWRFLWQLWVRDPKTSISVTGFIIYLLDVPVCWCLKSQKGVTLSSAQASYVAISENVKEVKFIYFLSCDLYNKLLLSRRIKLVLHLRRKMDQQAFVQSMWRISIVNLLIKFELIRSVENDADILTKNVSYDLNEEFFASHGKKFI
jgi:hypothetical protein